jgi:hypothetical protein
MLVFKYNLQFLIVEWYLVDNSDEHIIEAILLIKKNVYQHRWMINRFFTFLMLNMSIWLWIFECK